MREHTMKIYFCNKKSIAFLLAVYLILFATKDSFVQISYADEELLPAKATETVEDLTVTTVEKVTLKNVKNPSKGKMKITFQEVEHADGYEITYATDKKFKKNKRVCMLTGTKKIIKNLPKNQTYYVHVRAYILDSSENKVYGAYSARKKIKITKGLTQVSPSAAVTTIRSCKITADNKVRIKVKAKNYVTSKDTYYYIFALRSYQNSISKALKPLAKKTKATSFSISVPLNQDTKKSVLQSKFVVAVKKSSGKYEMISKPKYITNPQKNALFHHEFPVAATKKGLQVNGDMLADAEDLGVNNTAINISLNDIIAEPSEQSQTYSIPFTYNGKTYWFRRSSVYGYDQLLNKMKEQDIVVTAILLLGWRDDLTYLITPSGRTPGHNYYTLNTSGKKARNHLEAAFTFLAKRYANDQSKQISNWILGNEVNSYGTWNYAGNIAFEKYVSLYADSYRLLYTSVKSMYSNARVYISLDHYWNYSMQGTVGGKQFLAAFSQALKQNGKIPFHIAYHAYPWPLTDPEFWKNKNGMVSGKEDSKIINMANLSVLTDYVKKHYGKKTRILLSEQGFNSVRYGKNIEKKQAAAMVYSYYVAEFDPMIDAFIMSRHIDHEVETAQGLYFGLWSTKSSTIQEWAYQKKYSWNIYKYMDSPRSKKATKFALAEIGTSKWKNIIPHFKASKFSSMPQKVKGKLAIVTGYSKTSSLSSNSWEAYGSTAYHTYQEKKLTIYRRSYDNINHLWGITQSFETPLDFSTDSYLTATVMLKGSASGKANVKLRFFSGDHVYDVKGTILAGTNIKIGTSLQKFKYRTSIDRIEITFEPYNTSGYQQSAYAVITDICQSSSITK